MAEDNWQPARLIPTSGIAGNDEAERRATSALMAVMGAVREFGLAIIRPLGAPTAPIETFIEVPFPLGERRVIPDGLIRCTRAGRTWTALVEVKTGSADLERDQIEAYLDVARENEFPVVLTISNQLAPAPGVHPVEVDRRKLRKVALHHLSWAEVVTTAVQQRVHRGVSDPDQAWILSELIRYLEHPRSGALDFSDMGASWVTVREAVSLGTLRAADKGVPDVASRWEQLLRFAALRLGRELGAEVQVVVSRKEAAEPSSRLASHVQSLVTTGQFSGAIRIAGSAANLELTADLRTNRITASVEVDAPREGRPLTRVNWLVRQLGDAPGALRIDTTFLGSRSSTSELLSTVRADPSVVLDPQRRDIRSFRISATSPLGTKRGTGRGAFIDSVLAAVDGFYRAVLQQLRPWSPKAPQMPRLGRSAVEEAGIDIEPPESDLQETAEPELLGAPAEAPETAPRQEGPFAFNPVDEGASVDSSTDLVEPSEEQHIVDQPDELQQEAAAQEPPPPMITWTAALDRLDDERPGERHRPSHDY